MKFKLIALLFYVIPLSSEAIVGGKLDTTNGNGVIQIKVSDGGACTATKIGKRLLITAAHCFDDSVSLTGFSDKTTNQGKEYKALTSEMVHIHPSYQALSKTTYEDTINVIDMAIVRVQENDEFDQIPIRQLDFSLVFPLTRLVFYGYGCDKSVNDIKGYVPKRKIAETESLNIASLQSKHGIMTPLYRDLSSVIYQNSIVTPGSQYNPTQASVCLGDSGGPIFKNGNLVGINTLYTFNDVTSEGNSVSGVSYLNLHARVSAAKEWILGTLNEELDH